MGDERVELAPFDAAEFIDTPEQVAAYLEDAMADPDPAEFVAALGVVARARGMSDIAKAAGVARPALYRSLSAEGRPEFGTIMRVLQAACAPSLCDERASFD